MNIVDIRYNYEKPEQNLTMTDNPIGYEKLKNKIYQPRYTSLRH